MSRYIQPWFVAHRVILEYLQGFSKDIGGDSITRYNSNVLRLEKECEQKWRVVAREARRDPQTQKLTAFCTQDVRLSFTSSGYCTKLTL
jgi:hypothetical protein